MKIRRSWALVLAAACFLACSSTTAPSSNGGSTDVPQPVTQTVGATGGTVNAPGIVLTIPPGALPNDTTITITPNGAPVPSDYTALSSLYTFEPDGTVFLKPLTVDFTLTGSDPGATVFWSNASGGFDALPTTTTATTASASVMHFSRGFAGHKKSEQPIDSGADAEPTDAGSDATSTGVGTITAHVDNGASATTFASNPSVVSASGLSVIRADDNPTSTHWTLQLTINDITTAQTCTQASNPVVTYTHYTAGVVDDTFSTHSVQSYCSVTYTTIPTATGDHAVGTFAAAASRISDAGFATHAFNTGTFDVTM